MPIWKSDEEYNNWKKDDTLIEDAKNMYKELKSCREKINRLRKNDGEAFDKLRGLEYPGLASSLLNAINEIDETMLELRHMVGKYVITGSCKEHDK